MQLELISNAESEPYSEPVMSPELRHMGEEAWKNDDFKTNRRLKDGDCVELLVRTRGSNDHVCTVLPGTKGTVIHARTPRVIGPGVYFANVDVILSDSQKARIRVPHNAIRRCATAARRANQ